jgi:hypothetical protein
VVAAVAVAVLLGRLAVRAVAVDSRQVLAVQRQVQTLLLAVVAQITVHNLLAVAVVVRQP